MTLLAALVPIAVLATVGARLLLRQRPSRRSSPFIRAHRSTRHRGAEVGDIQVRPGSNLR